jgi:2-polyprenyl-6-methoxyphenol hydroxylase-like FAD-dependent oxidoreductase
VTGRGRGRRHALVIGGGIAGPTAAVALQRAGIDATVLRDLPDASAAFAQFERLRRPRVERVVAWAARMNRNKMPGPIARAVRDAVLPLVLRRAARQTQGWLFDYQIAWDEGLVPAA